MSLLILRSRASKQAPGPMTLGGAGAYGAHVIYSAFTAPGDWSRPPVPRGSPGSASSLTTTAVTAEPAPFGLSASFNGTTSTTGVSRIATLPSLITISWWMYKPSYQSGTNIAFNFQSGGSTEASNGFYFSPDHSSGNMLTRTGNGGVNGISTQWSRPAAGTWNHFLLGIDKGAASAPYLSINGFAQTAVTGTVTGPAVATWGDNPLYFGQYGDGSLFCNVRIANFYIFNTLLTQAAANDLYMNPYQMVNSPRRYGSTKISAGAGSRWFLTH